MPAIPDAVQLLADRSRVAWGFSPEPDVLQAWVESVGTAVEKVDVGLALACGLFHRVPAAAAAFERLVAPRVLASVRKVGASAVEAEEHLQAARVRLLVDDGGSRLKGYRGLGSFDAFVTTVAVRALSNARQAVRPSDDEKAIAALPAAADLERALSRSGQQQHFAEAFRGALAALSARERALLRLNLVEGASIDELAPMYAVSRATVARWLASAKQALQHQTISALSLHTRVQGPELEHLLTSLQSGFDLSLRRFVAEAAVEERGP